MGLNYYNYSSFINPWLIGLCLFYLMRTIKKLSKGHILLIWLGVEDYSVHPCTSPLRGQLHFVQLFKFAPGKFVEPKGSHHYLLANKKEKAVNHLFLFKLAGGRGFEPLLTESESVSIAISIGFTIFYSV